MMGSRRCSSWETIKLGNNRVSKNSSTKDQAYKLPTTQATRRSRQKSGAEEASLRGNSVRSRHYLSAILDSDLTLDLQTNRFFVCNLLRSRHLKPALLRCVKRLEMLIVLHLFSKPVHFLAGCRQRGHRGGCPCAE